MWTFLPLNMFEQFRRIANFYFLVATVIVVSKGQVHPSLAPI